MGDVISGVGLDLFGRGYQDIDQACPTFLVLRAIFTWGNLLQATNIFVMLQIPWFGKLYVITQGDNESKLHAVLPACVDVNQI